MVNAVVFPLAEDRFSQSERYSWVGLVRVTESLLYLQITVLSFAESDRQTVCQNDLFYAVQRSNLLVIKRQHSDKIGIMATAS